MLLHRSSRSTRVECYHCDNYRVYGSVASMQRSHESQQDFHNCMLNIDEDTSLFAIYDAHGDSNVAKCCSQLLPMLIKKNKYYKTKNLKRALISSFLELDAALQEKATLYRATFLSRTNKKSDVVKDEEGDGRNGGSNNGSPVGETPRDEGISHGGDGESDDLREILSDEEESETGIKFWNNTGFTSGCTAVVALLRGEKLYVASLGDSRCFMFSDGMAINLTTEHRPSDEGEKNRIIKAGGRLSPGGRINGLNVSRAFGHFYWKSNPALSQQEQMIIALPDVIEARLPEDSGNFLVMASNGLWKFSTCFWEDAHESNYKVLEFILRRPCTPPSLICKELVECCLSQRPSWDGKIYNNVMVLMAGWFSKDIKKSIFRKKTTEKEQPCSEPKVSTTAL